MDRAMAPGLEDRLLTPAGPGRFDPAELDGLPEPVRRHLAQAIAPGTPLYTSARLRMRGAIKVGRWLPFRARQVLSPHHGFVWTARAAGLVSGSAAGRAGAEGIWLPTALLPRFGVRWSAPAGDQVTAAFAVDGTPVELHCAWTRPGGPWPWPSTAGATPTAGASAGTGSGASSPATPASAA